jgi:hypothetical protein
VVVSAGGDVVSALGADAHLRSLLRLRGHTTTLPSSIEEEGGVSVGVA